MITLDEFLENPEKYCAILMNNGVTDQQKTLLLEDLLNMVANNISDTRIRTGN